MEELIVKALTGIVRVIKTTRESLALELEQVAAKIRAGELIADDAFDKAKETRDATAAARDKLPKE